MSISHYYLAFISQKQLSVTNISITSGGWGNGLGPTRAQAITQTQDVPHFQTHVKTNSIPYSVLNKQLNGTNKQRLITNRNKQLNSFKQTTNSLTVLCDLGDHKPAHNTSSIRTSIASNVMGSHNSTQVGCHGFSLKTHCLNLNQHSIINIHSISIDVTWPQYQHQAGSRDLHWYRLYIKVPTPQKQHQTRYPTKYITT